jgi:hypothetical protein
MATSDEIFTEYITMRKNGLEPKDALKTLRSFVESLGKNHKEALATQMRQWEREQLENRTTEVIPPVPEPPERVKRVSTSTLEPKWTECPNCGKKNRLTEVFCYACGQMLEPPLSKSLETQQFADATDMLFTDEYFGDDSILTFIVRDTGERFELRPQARKHEMVIGRSSNTGSLAPDLDLATAQGASLGVSRLHVALRYELNDSAIHIYDLGSANGSFINGQKLHPRETRILRNGDELRLGRLVLRVYYQHPGERI